MSQDLFTSLPFYPGPVSVPQHIRNVWMKDYGPPRTSPEFLTQYKECVLSLQKIIGTQNDVIIPTGEGMLGLWGSLKSTLLPGDRVLTIGTGLFGDGFADMARSLQCEVTQLSFPYDITLTKEHLQKIEETIRQVTPFAIILVHCETPSGTLNPIYEVGELKKRYDVPLFLVDAVSSMGGVPVDADKCHIDICMGGSQKCFACPADVSILSISKYAWERIDAVKYIGYDALLPFKEVEKDVYNFPYTPLWPGIAALHRAASAILEEGIEAVFERHQQVSRACINGLEELGIRLFPVPTAISSPTVTAAYVPEGFTPQTWQHTLRKEGLVVGGSLGPLKETVFRMGHMGPQANMDHLEKALEIIRKALSRR